MYLFGGFRATTAYAQNQRLTHTLHSDTLGWSSPPTVGAWEFSAPPEKHCCTPHACHSLPFSTQSSMINLATGRISLALYSSTTLCNHTETRFWFHFYPSSGPAWSLTVRFEMEPTKIRTHPSVTLRSTTPPQHIRKYTIRLPLHRLVQLCLRYAAAINRVCWSIKK